MNRRRAFSNVAQSAVFRDEPALPVLRETSLVRVTRRAMATTFEITLPFGTPDAVPAASSALDVIDEVEQGLTIYREDSETAHLNRHAFEHPIEVSDMLFDLLQRCGPLVQQTANAFDPGIGALVRAWGFTRRAGRVPSDAELASARACSGFKHVLLDHEKQTVKFLRQGLKLNFGSIGKGFALDLAARHLQHVWGIHVALLHGGGSSVRALGSPMDEPKGWPILLKHPHEPRRSLGTIHLNDAGLGVSAATYQHFVHEGKKYGHVIDPRTGKPAQGQACAAFIAPTATEADALSTAAFVSAHEEAERIVTAEPNRTLILLREDAKFAVVHKGDAFEPFRG